MFYCNKRIKFNFDIAKTDLKYLYVKGIDKKLRNRLFKIRHELTIGCVPIETTLTFRIREKLNSVTPSWDLCEASQIKMKIYIA